QWRGQKEKRPPYQRPRFINVRQETSNTSNQSTLPILSDNITGSYPYQKVRFSFHCSTFPTIQAALQTFVHLSYTNVHNPSQMINFSYHASIFHNKFLQNRFSNPPFKKRHSNDIPDQEADPGQSTNCI